MEGTVHRFFLRDRVTGVVYFDYAISAKRIHKITRFCQCVNIGNSPIASMILR
jgi:hypothetical protein